MRPDVRAQPLGAVPAQHEPQLERPEPPAQRHLPVPVVDHRAGLGGRVAQVLRQHGQRADQLGPVGDPEGVAVEAGQQPLVRVRSSTSRPAPARRATSAAPGRPRPRRRTRRRRAARPRTRAAERADRRHRVDRGGRGGADGRHHERRHAPRRPGRPRPPRAARPACIASASGSTSSTRSAASPRPAIRAAFSIEECALGRGVDRVPASRRRRCATVPPLARCSAASSAHQRGRGRGVLDDAAAGPRNGTGRQVEQLGQPVQHDGLQLGAGRRGGPEHALHAQAGADAGRRARPGRRCWPGSRRRTPGAASA